MRAAGAIAALDNALAKVGEDITLRRVTGTGNSVRNIDVTVRANVRNLSLQEAPLTGSIAQAVLQIVISPTQIKRAQWPGGVVPGQLIDPSIPRRTDLLCVKGRWGQVEACEAIAIDGENVRYEMRMMG